MSTILEIILSVAAMGLFGFSAWYLFGKQPNDPD